MDRALIITCEHAGNDLPARYRYLFHANPEVLQTHRGYDIGALELSRTISGVLNTKAHVHNVTRLLIDVNRSLQNPSVFSEYMDSVGRDERRSIIEQYYLPYRQKVQRLIAGFIAEGEPVLHLSVHTFTPVLRGNVRNTDIGLLYDPRCSTEKNFCRTWKRQLRKQLPEHKYRMNYPYRGTMDGFTTHLREEFSEKNYSGIELEVNQRFAKSTDQAQWIDIQNEIALSLKSILGM